MVCVKPHDGWLPSAGLLLGFACELLAKRRLIHNGVPESKLRNPPYGHDISEMWKNQTALFSEGQVIVDRFLKAPNPKGIDAHFDWDLHFNQLALGHSSDGDYFHRYHQGEVHFANPKAVCVVLAEICALEQEKSLNWSDS